MEERRQALISTMARQALIDESILRAALVGLEQKRVGIEEQMAAVRKQRSQATPG
jgi:hypothetical protein